MEVGVQVCVEDLRTGEIRHTSSAYLTFVALGDDGKPAPPPPVIPETEQETRRFEQAGARRSHRLELRRRFEITAGNPIKPCTCT
jgi:acyl-CoA hydrolase